MTEQELIRQIARDIGIEKYRFEPSGAYNCRVVYSALGQWYKHIVKAQRDMETEKQGSVKKATAHRRVREVLDSFVSINECYRDYFDSENNIDSINVIRDTLTRAGELEEIGFESRLILGDGLFTNSWKKTASGLAVVPDEMPSIENILRIFNIPSMSSAEMYQEYVSKARWTKITEYDNYEFFSPKSRRVFSECWIQGLLLEDNMVYMVRKSNSFGVYDYQLAKKEDEAIYVSPFSEYAQDPEIRDTQRILFGIKALFGNQMTVTCNIYGEYCEWNFWSTLPPAENYLFNYIGWPSASIKNQKNGFLIRKEFSPLVEYIIANLNMKKEERKIE